MQVTFSLQDTTGVAVDTVTEMVSWIPKADSVIVAPLVIGFDIPQEPVAMTVTTVVDDYKDTDDLEEVRHVHP